MKQINLIGKIPIMAVLLVLLLMGTGMASADITVSDGGSIQAAINAASSGDTITVEAGTYDEQLLIETDLTLIGEEGAIIRPTTSNKLLDKVSVIRINDATVIIEGFEIDGNNGVVDHVVYDAIYAKGGLPGYESSVDVTIRNNLIHNYNKNGITINGALATATIEGNTVTGRGLLYYGDYCQNGIQLGWGASGTITGNTVTDHHYRVRDVDNKFQYDAQYTDWAATGILLYDVNPELVKSSVLKSQNTFDGNEFNILVRSPWDPLQNQKPSK